MNRRRGHDSGSDGVVDCVGDASAVAYIPYQLWSRIGVNGQYGCEVYTPATTN